MAREKVEVQVKLDVADAQKQLADAQKQSKKARAEAGALGGSGARGTQLRYQFAQRKKGGALRQVGSGLRAGAGGVAKVLGIVGIVYIAIKTLLTLVRAIGMSIGEWFPRLGNFIEETSEGISEKVSKLTTAAEAGAKTFALQKQAAAAGLNTSLSGSADVFSSTKAAAERETQRRDRSTAKAGADIMQMIRGLSLGGAG
jgi:F0F1-type ATP synthase membrane subunit b/b'